MSETGRITLIKLTQLAAAATLEDLKYVPGNRLEALKGTRAGQHSIRINGQYRICFRWEDGQAKGIEIVDTTSAETLIFCMKVLA